MTAFVTYFPTAMAAAPRRRRRYPAILLVLCAIGATVVVAALPGGVLGAATLATALALTFGMATQIRACLPALDGLEALLASLAWPNA